MVLSYCNMLFLVLVFGQSSNLVKSWDYQNFHEWGEISPTCNVGENQSPIDLRANVLSKTHRTKALQFLNYKEEAQELEITNNGHTVQLVGTWSGNKPSISGEIFSRGLYTFSNFHIHWSTTDNNGSDHAIEGQKYAAELHLVHLNQQYRTRSEALKHVDGIAVIGILLEVDDSVSSNPGIRQFASLAQEILNTNMTDSVASFDLTTFIPHPLPPLYSYFGSLTTPPCIEDVRWVVLSEPQPISSEIIRLFRNIKLDHGDTHNVRPMQPIFNRRIHLYNH